MYHSLYRKYRPQGFDSVVGQETVIKTLKNSIKNHSFSHAYMFFGPRGTGKTTISKLFARSVNCLDSDKGRACGVCKNCIHSIEKECVDIIEIDAASNNGVDEIRELRNKISLVPAELKYKVYIIDEVHMLSIGAFNALLKTLEEPPNHVIFILATTDPQKVPETIVSRCQCFSFKRISVENIVQRLDYVCKQEHIEIDSDVLKEIALVSEGGLRDALGLLDKLSSYSDSKITLVDFADLNGMITRKELDQFAKSIFNADISNLLYSISNYSNSGKNLIQIMSQLIYYLRDEIINYYIDQVNSSYSIDISRKLINLINEKMFDIKRSSNPVIYIEMILLEFIDKYVDKESIVQRKPVEKEKKELKNNIIVDETVSVIDPIPDYFEVKSSAEISKNNASDDNQNNMMDVEEKENFSYKLNVKNMKEILDIRINNTFAEANKNILKQELSNIKLFSDYTFDQEIGYIACSLLDCHLRAASNDNIIISYEYDSIVKQNIANLNQIIYVYNKITNSNKKIAIVTDAEWEKLKEKYISDLRDGNLYKIQEEPDEIVDEPEKNDIIANSAIELFGDIVEIN